METVLLSAGMLSSFIVIKSNVYSDKGYAHYDEDGFALLGEKKVFKEKVKIEVERATDNDRYVHLRFCHSNRYWARKDRFIVAESNQPEEDTTKSSCTLFEAVSVAGGNELFYLNHVQSGGRLLFEEPSMRFYVNANPNPTDGYLSIVNWNSLVILPKHVAFKGDNGKYLHAFRDNNNFLKFKGDDPNDVLSGHEVSWMDDGHVRIKSDFWGTFWRRSPNWIWADSYDTTANNRDTLFWPVKIDETTIALRNAGNNNFCKRLTAENNESCLNAAVSTMTTEARLAVEELVSRRRIHRVRYRMEDSRIFNETPFAAGTTAVYNYTDSEASVSVEIEYVDSESRSFSRSLSLSAGVTTTIEASVPLISSASIETSYEINTTLEWNKTTTTAKSAKGIGSVPVPPRSLAFVSYVGTMGTCDIPFSYSQEDTSSTDGKIIPSEHIDGVYRGVNAYNFTFVMEKAQPLS